METALGTECSCVVINRYLTRFQHVTPVSWSRTGCPLLSVPNSRCCLWPIKGPGYLEDCLSIHIFALPLYHIGSAFSVFPRGLRVLGGSPGWEKPGFPCGSHWEWYTLPSEALLAISWLCFSNSVKTELLKWAFNSTFWAVDFSVVYSHYCSFYDFILRDYAVNCFELDSVCGKGR